ncbi:MAG: DUF4350 domain-containing protein [Candidatus Thorarchaeota archaeon]
MKDKVVVCTLIVLFLSVSFLVPIRVVQETKEPLVAEKQIEVAQAQMVLFDESHVPYGSFTHDLWFSNFTSDLEAEGYTVDNMTSWDENTLMSADVVIIAVPTVAYSMNEFYTLHNFLAKGGGFFLIGDIPSVSEAAALAELFGFYFSATELQDSDNHYGPLNWIQWDRVSNFGNHPITTGVSNLTTYLGHGIIEYPGLGVPLMMMDADENSTYAGSGDYSSGTAAMVAIEYPGGLGRMVVTADSNQFWSIDFNGDGDEEYYEGDNDLLARNIINWLSSAPIPEDIIVFDESHNAQRRTGVTSKHFNILFDESESPEWGIDNNDNGIYGWAEDSSWYGDLAAFLEGSGMSVDKMSTWDWVTAASSDVLVLVDPDTLYDTSDAEVLRSLVAQGLGLLLLGDRGTWIGDGAVQIAELFGVDFYDGTLSDSDENYNANEVWILMDGTNLADHPSLSGVSEVGLIATGGFNNFPIDTEIILSSDTDSSSGWFEEPPGSPSAEGVPSAIAFQYGRGRVMMIADSGMFANGNDEFLEFGNNSLFAINAIRWLAEGTTFLDYYHCANELRNQGYGVMAMIEFSSSFLEGTDALVLANPILFYSEGEKTVIDEYVSVQGNGLLMLGDVGGPVSSLRDFAADYGIIFDGLGSSLVDEDDFVEPSIHDLFQLDEFNLQSHYLTEGVEGLLWRWGTGIIEYPEDADVILEMDDDTFSEWANGSSAAGVAMMIASTNGTGRILTIGDSNLWDNTVLGSDIFSDKKTMTLYELNNSLLLINSIEWLLGEGNGGTPTPFELPWWALPAVGGGVLVIALGFGISRRSKGKETTAKKSTTKKKTKTKTKKK